jgi:hypothetical protein
MINKYLDYHIGSFKQEKSKQLQVQKTIVYDVIDESIIALHSSYLVQGFP